MIDSIIAKYLKYNKRITIPELGTLVRKDSEGIFVLVEFLRKDDGVLAGLLRNESNLSEHDAAAAISNYVGSIREEVEKQGSVSLKGIGILSLGNDGLLELDSVKIRLTGQEPIQDRTTPDHTRNAEHRGITRNPEPRTAKEPSTGTTRKSVTVDENGELVGDDLFDDKPRKGDKGSTVADSVASLFAGAKGVVNSVTGKINAPGEKRHKISARQATAEDNRDNGSDRGHTRSDARRTLDPNRKFSDLKPQPEIRGLRYKSSGGYAKRKSPMDKILLIAIVAAILAILVMVYGQIVNRHNKPEPLIEDQTEMPVTQPFDTTAE